jgi:anti-sigma B factor antagonist
VERHDARAARGTSSTDAFAVAMRYDHDVGTVRLAGELDLNGIEKLAATVDQLLDRNVAAVRVDTSDLRFIDATGLAALVEAQAAARAAGARFQLRGTSAPVERVIDLAGLSEVLIPQGR